MLDLIEMILLYNRAMQQPPAPEPMTPRFPEENWEDVEIMREPYYHIPGEFGFDYRPEGFGLIPREYIF